MSFHIEGVVPPLLTPMNEAQEIDLGALEQHVRWLVENGVHGLMPCGTTGEGPLLTINERKQVLEAVMKASAGRAPVLPHVGAAATREAIELARHAAAVGVAAVSAVSPFYYRLSDEAQVEHFRRIAEAVPDTPVFLYNIPQNSGNSISVAVAEAVIRLCPNVIGIKDSSGSLDNLRSYTKLREGSFQVACGSDGLVLAALEAGAQASISGNANVFPQVVVDLYTAYRQGDLDRARKQQALLDQVRTALGDGGSLSLLKRALELRGLTGGCVRSPLPEAGDRLIADAQAKLRDADLLP